MISRARTDVRNHVLDWTGPSGHANGAWIICTIIPGARISQVSSRGRLIWRAERDGRTDGRGSNFPTVWIISKVFWQSVMRRGRSALCSARQRTCGMSHVNSIKWSLMKNTALRGLKEVYLSTGIKIYYRNLTIILRELCQKRRTIKCKFK